MNKFLHCLKNNKNLIMSCLVATLLVVVSIFGLVGCKDKTEARTTLGKASKLTELAIGKSKGEVMAVLGSPTETTASSYIYAPDTKEKLKEKTFQYIQVDFDAENKVKGFCYNTRHKMADGTFSAVGKYNKDILKSEVDVVSVVQNTKLENIAMVYRIDYADDSIAVVKTIPASIDYTVTKSKLKYADIYQWSKAAELESSVKVTVPSSGTSVIDSFTIVDGTLTKFEPKVGEIDVEIPEGVKIIRDAFVNKKDLLSVKIPDSVEIIGEDAFYSCTSLNTVNISASSKINAIYPNAFFNTKALTSIYIPKNVKIIGGWAFNSSGITKITIAAESQLASIETFAFAYCEQLVDIIIQKSVKEIGAKAFADCKKLTIKCVIREALKPDGWDAEWNTSDCTVVWGYTEEV